MGNKPNARLFPYSIALVMMATSVSTTVAAEDADGWQFADEFRLQSLELDNSTTGSASGGIHGGNYCINILDEARETRNAVLTERLTTLEKQVDQKLDLMAERIAALKAWTERRDNFLKKSNDSLVQIFQSMRPDAAASQLTEIGPAMSASIIAKLEPKYSSAILTEMKPSDAAKITMVLTNLAVNNANR